MAKAKSNTVFATAPGQGSPGRLKGPWLGLVRRLVNKVLVLFIYGLSRTLRFVATLGFGPPFVSRNYHPENLSSAA